MEVWFVNWEDLSSVWSSKGKALEFLRGEAQRVGAQMVITEEYETTFWVAMRYENGWVDHIDCCQYNVNDLPY
jgi:hypothetical protein